jgi:hypothetical protein
MEMPLNIHQVDFRIGTRVDLTAGSRAGLPVHIPVCP